VSGDEKKRAPVDVDIRVVALLSRIAVALEALEEELAWVIEDIAGRRGGRPGIGEPRCGVAYLGLMPAGAERLRIVEALESHAHPEVMRCERIEGHPPIAGLDDDEHVFGEMKWKTERRTDS
jgi:hypothetical protein